MKAAIKSAAALLCLAGAVQSPVSWAVPIHATMPATAATPAVPAIPGLSGERATPAIRARPPVAASPIPEAHTYAMMLAGLGLVGVMVARRRRY